jgi:hypothetical protein
MTFSLSLSSAAYINWLKHPLQDSIEGLETGFKHGVAGGNPAFATACAYNLMGTFWSVAPLHQIAPLIGTSSSGTPSSRLCRLTWSLCQNRTSDTRRRRIGATW